MPKPVRMSDIIRDAAAIPVRFQLVIFMVHRS